MPSVKYHVKSPTGCVHLSEEKDTPLVNGSLSQAYFRTMCNHADYYKSHGDEFYHAWEEVHEPVTCKRCLKILSDAFVKRVTTAKPVEEDPRAKVVISIVGGVLSEVYSNDPDIEIVLYDFDDIASVPADIKRKEKEYQKEIENLTQVA